MLRIDPFGLGVATGATLSLRRWITFGACVVGLTGVVSAGTDLDRMQPDSPEWQDYKATISAKPGTVDSSSEPTNRVLVAPFPDPGVCSPADATYSGLPANDDGSTGVIPLPFTFSLFGTNYNQTFVNNNGNLTFTAPTGVFSASGFPFSVPMVAPFWSDVDTRTGPITRYKTIGTNTFVATWEFVGYYFTHLDKTNTFQVRISNGTNAEFGGCATLTPSPLGCNNVCFCYGDMQWTTGDASSGVGGFGGIPATVGANRGNGIDFFQIGRFDHAGVDYDGPGGNNDGISYLDNRQYCFNTSDVNIPPIAANFPPNDTVTVSCGGVVNQDLQFTGPETAQTVSVAVSDPNGAVANGLVITNTPGNPSHLLLNWTTDPGDVGTYVLTLTATDNGNPVGTTVKTLTIIVQACANQPPSCNAGATTTNGCSMATITGATATDTDGNALTYSWSSNNPNVAVSPASGSLAAGPTGAQPLGTFTATLTGTTPCGRSAVLTLTVTDSVGAMSTCTTSVTFNDTVDPTFNLPVPGNTTVACTTALPAPPTVTASDNCDTNVAVTFVQSALVGTECNGTITRTWTATDDCGNDITHVQTITVRDDVDPTFTLPLPTDITITCSTALPNAPTVTASDNCDTSVTVGLVTGPLVGTECNGTITRTWTATDDCGNDITHVQTITVRDDVDPTFALPLPTDITITCSTALPNAPTVTASDNCDTSVTVGLVTGPLVGTECNGTITRTWTATDDCGNDITHVQTITVHDDVDPTIAGVPGAITVECDAVPAPAEPTASDNCDAAPTLDYDQVRTDGNCEDNYTLTRTWTATDVCGNDTVETQVITVQDTTAPTAIGVLSPVMPLPANSAASACSPASRGEFRIVCDGSDNCDDMPVLSAKLRSAQSVVGPNSTCVTVVTEVDVACDQVVVIELQAAPCPGAGPTSARPATSVDSTGVLTVYGEHVLLEVTATDRCGNSGTDIFDPSAECEVGGGDLCCPAVARPASNCTNPCAVPFDESPTTRAAISPGVESNDLAESSDAGRSQR